MIGPCNAVPCLGKINDLWLGLAVQAKTQVERIPGIQFVTCSQPWFQGYFIIPPEILHMESGVSGQGLPEMMLELSVYPCHGHLSGYVRTRYELPIIRMVQAVQVIDRKIIKDKPKTVVVPGIDLLAELCAEGQPVLLLPASQKGHIG